MAKIDYRWMEPDEVGKVGDIDRRMSFIIQDLIIEDNGKDVQWDNEQIQGGIPTPERGNEGIQGKITATTLMSLR